MTIVNNFIPVTMTPTAAVDLDSWYDHVLPEVSGCTEPMALQAIRSALYEMCWRSWIWRITIDLGADGQGNGITEGYNTYTIPAPSAYGKILRPLNLVFNDGTNDAIVPPRTRVQLQASNANYKTEQGPRPQYFMRIANLADRVTLYPIPDTTYADIATLSARVVIVPDDSDLQTEEFLFTDEQWRDAITYGALARLTEQRNKPYSDRELSARNWQRFRTGVAEAKSTFSREDQYIGGVAQFPTNFA